MFKNKIIKLMLSTLIYLNIFNTTTFAYTNNVNLDESKIQPVESFILSSTAKQLLDNIKECNKSFKIYCSSLNPGFVENNLDEIKHNFPLDGYNVSGYTAYYTSSDYITINCEYFVNSKQKIELNNKISQILSVIIKDGMRDEEKVKSIHNWISNNIEYDYSLKITDHYNTLTKRKGVCIGYALLFQNMNEMAGIKSQIITGIANGGSHAWNIVYLSDLNSWRHVDSTWDSIKDKNGNIKAIDNYLNLTDEEIGKNHSWIKGVYPKAK